MPALFESGAFGGNQPAWDGCGEVFEEDVIETKRMLELAGLNWRVSQRPLFIPNVTGDDFVQATDEFVAIVRDDTDSVLATVGARYRPIQNSESLSILDGIFPEIGAKWHTAGSLDGGRMVWGLAKLPNTVTLRGLPNDPHEDYVLVTNAHDGRYPFTIMPTRVRVVCYNTLNMALAGAENRYEVKHTLGAEPRIEEARNALAVVGTYFDNLTTISEELVDQPFSDRQWTGILDELIPLPANTQGIAYRNAEEERENCNYLWNYSDTLDGMSKCKYRAVNAFIEWDNHYRKSRNSRGQNNAAENRMKRILITDKSISEKALSLIQEA